VKDADFCAAFCDTIALRPVPIGYVFKTPFRRPDGDAIALYVRGNSAGEFRLEDDGQTIGFLETSGVDLDSETRFEAFSDLLKEYDSQFDENECVVHSEWMAEADIPSSAVRFSALLLRIYDLLLLSANRVRSTFKDDLIALVQQQFGPDARIDLNEPLQASMKDYIVDIIVRSPDGRSLAIFAATSELKALEALLFWREARTQNVDTVRSMLVLESAKPAEIKTRTLSRVMNSGIALASMDGEELAIRQKMAENLTYH
jgi:Domain of unknown function DUF1828